MNHTRTKLLIMAMAGLGLVACGKQEQVAEGSTRPELPSVEVRVARAQRIELPNRVDVNGVVLASQRASIAPKVMGVVSQFPVGLGQSVKAGELLVKIDAAEIDAKVSQAETQLRQAERDLQREETLLEKGASTSELVRNLADRVAITRSMLDEAKAMLDYTEIRAPFDGTVSRKYVEAGGLVSPGMPVVELDGTSGFEIEAGVPESLVSSLRIGDAFPVELPTDGSRFEAVLSEFSSGARAQSRVVMARFLVPETVSARAGQFARVSLSGNIVAKILVPRSAVSRVGQLERVFVAEGSKASLRLVKTGASQGDQVEIVSGLDADELVVVDLLQAIQDGQPLEVVR